MKWRTFAGSNGIPKDAIEAVWALLLDVYYGSVSWLGSALWLCIMAFLCIIAVYYGCVHDASVCCLHIKGIYSRGTFEALMSECHLTS